MTPGLLKMWISLTGIGLMFVSVFSIYFSRYKVKNKVIKIVLATIAYISMIIAGLIIVFVVFSGPVQE
ncbi:MULTISPECIES: DUF2768 domain-containing protein [Anoxybacillus]|uniref:NAD(FAD)-dependent dehydrogenase n=1 Tax=Anoxybacillus mongoliensis TaxID=452565 RepID=A0A7W8JF06_9BACL|nr:DUF2768 domain-containing protein [Anoxybacillus mongoliensis]MBB5355790.1 hypothetical protein [Anoxybacillus mongoliensis]MCX8001268.1 DUF2768 domain-containing protein [Anoxybacillus mongoliensis]